MERLTPLFKFSAVLIHNNHHVYQTTASGPFFSQWIVCRDSNIFSLFLDNAASIVQAAQLSCSTVEFTREQEIQVCARKALAPCALDGVRACCTGSYVYTIIMYHYTIPVPPLYSTCGGHLAARIYVMQAQWRVDYRVTQKRDQTRLKYYIAYPLYRP